MQLGDSKLNPIVLPVYNHLGHPAWGGKWCRCHTCGLVGMSSFAFDFYEVVKDEKPIGLECESCMRLDFAEQGIPVVTHLETPNG